MALYGKQTQGALTRDIEIDVVGREITLVGGEVIVAAFAYLQTTNGSTADVKVALYNSSDVPAYQSNQLSFTDDVGGWKTITWAGGTTPIAGTYKLSIGAGGISGGTNTVNIFYDTVSVVTSLREASNILAGAQSTYPTLPNPITWSAPDNTQDISLYLQTSSTNSQAPRSSAFMRMLMNN